MNYMRQGPTEECPLTKERKGCSVSDCCGFRSIICLFIVLTIIITAALIFQLVYDDNAFQGNLNVHGAVATDYSNCSQIGTKVLLKGGNAVDAAIAATLCMSVVAPHKTSLGSGGYFMIYNHKNQENPKIIDFLSNTIPDEFEKIQIRIPAMLRGMEYAHAMYGQLTWYDLVIPSVVLARKGFEISRDFLDEATRNTNIENFGITDDKKILKQPILANTLEAVAKFGVDVIYNGSITSKLFFNKTINEELLKELSNYQPKVIEAQKSTFSQYEVFYPSASNSLQSVIEEINKLNISKENASLIESEIIAAETVIKLFHQLKNSYINYTESRRYTGVSAVDWQDTYVSVISGLSTPLDLKYKTDAGFVFDNTANRNSLLSLTPIIFYDKTTQCGLRGTFSADDAVITEQILYNLLLRSMDVSAAVEYPRFYILSDGIVVENDERHSGNRLLRDSLLAIDITSEVETNMIMKSVNVIIKRKNLISGHSDSRGDGIASRF